MPTLSAFGRLAGYHRVDTGVTLKQMAEVLGVHPTTLTAVEQGKRPVPPEWIAKLPEKLALAVIDQCIMDHKNGIVALENQRIKITTKYRGGGIGGSSGVSL